MSWNVFADPGKLYSVVLFVQSADIETHRVQFESLGNQRNVKLVVQPCPFEGIEFLSRIGHDLIGHHMSMEKEIFWQAIEVKPETSKKAFQTISDHHYKYLCAILEQDNKAVERERKYLEALAEHFF